mgnify:CR=1 FL=1
MGFRTPQNSQVTTHDLSDLRMSALGHKQTSRDVRVTSALPPIADIRRMSWHVRLVPQADVDCSRLVSSIWVRAFLFVFENLARLRIHSDFVYGTAALDVEGVAETAAALLLFQLLVGNSSRSSFQSYGTGLFHVDLRALRQSLAGVRDQMTTEADPSLPR